MPLLTSRVLIDAVRSYRIQIVWWTDDSSQVSNYSLSCHALSVLSEHPADREQNGIAETAGSELEHGQIILNVSNFKDHSINRVNVDGLVPRTRYRCCLYEHYVDHTFTADVACQIKITTAVNCTALKPTDCSLLGVTVSLFVMLVIAMMCTLLLFKLFLKQGEYLRKIARW